MAHVSDYSQISKKVLLDLINAENVLSLTNAMIDFALPQADVGGGEKNTSVGITAVAGSGYTGQVVVQYNRVQMSAFVFDQVLEFQKGDATSVKDFIPELNTLLGFNLSDGEYIDAPLDEFTGAPNESHPLQVVASADSLVFLGSLTLTIKGADVDLATVITKLVLDGLYPPVAPA